MMLPLYATPHAAKTLFISTLVASQSLAPVSQAHYVPLEQDDRSKTTESKDYSATGFQAGHFSTNDLNHSKLFQGHDCVDIKHSLRSFGEPFTGKLLLGQWPQGYTITDLSFTQQRLFKRAPFPNGKSGPVEDPHAPKWASNPSAKNEPPLGFESRPRRPHPTESSGSNVASTSGVKVIESQNSFREGFLPEEQNPSETPPKKVQDEVKPVLIENKPGSGGGPSPSSSSSGGPPSGEPPKGPHAEGPSSGPPASTPAAAPAKSEGPTGNHPIKGPIKSSQAAALQTKQKTYLGMKAKTAKIVGSVAGLATLGAVAYAWVKSQMRKRSNDDNDESD